VDENHLTIGENRIYCTGVRTHVKRSAEIINFRLLRECKWDPIDKKYLLVGIVGREEPAGFEEIAPTIG
jgi:hypothetical protein